MKRLPKANLQSQLLRYGDPGAGRSMRSRKAGQISATRQALLDWPNLHRAWDARRERCRLRKVEGDAEQARAASEAAAARVWGVSLSVYRTMFSRNGR